LNRYFTSNENRQGLRDLGNDQDARKAKVHDFYSNLLLLSEGGFRLEAAPEFTIEEWPAAVQVQSKHNTPIEGFWRWKRQGEGHSIQDAIMIGKTDGLFNQNNELHMYVLTNTSALF
jgi:hypothetical protein